ncbi:MAG: YtxH domain-containing protein [Muribaculaceae bacterium]|nr:YtxH domain-containing protein [Muribaculaceae bacterium]
MKPINIFLAVIGGAIAGATVGLLMAPEKGEDTRKQVADYLKSKGIKLKKTKIEELAEEISTDLEKK